MGRFALYHRGTGPSYVIVNTTRLSARYDTTLRTPPEGCHARSVSRIVMMPA